MKLKQRVIVTSTLFLSMTILFLVGTHLSWPGVSEGDRRTDHISSVKREEVHPSHSSPSLPAPSRASPKPPNFEKLAERLRNVGLQSPPKQGSLRFKDIFNSTNVMRDQLFQFQNHTLLKRRLVELSNWKPHTNRPVTSSRHEKPQVIVSDNVSRLNPWEIWEAWVTPNHLYPDHAFFSDEMNHILVTMATAPITSFEVGYRGTQLKATLMLGGQRTVFKPKRYERDDVIEGDPYAGFDRHNGEIAGFHLDGILGFQMAPPVVGRQVNLTALKPVTQQNLLSTYLTKDGNTCFYGKCYYCRPEEAACADGEIMEGSVTLWLPKWYELKTRRHPYQRTYRPGVRARWEVDGGYCRTLLKPTSEYYYGMLEIVDSAVFDFLMGNADRHHYETYSRSPQHGRIMHIDNGKTFGNPHHDELSILAPLTQCCRLRLSTWNKLITFQNSSLSQALDHSLQRDPLWPILNEQHLTAIDRRFHIAMEAINTCISQHGRTRVLVDRIDT